MKPAVLFVRRDSVYKTLDCDPWDFDRDAKNWPGGAPCVVHPPCRAWATLAHMANPRPGERELAPWAADQVRRWGGVLEHPALSRLWKEHGLPEPGKRDAFGGFTIVVLQWWWGHRAEKATRLYVCGCEPKDVPEMPFRIGESSHVVNTGHGIRKGDPRHRPHCTKNERERTPPEFAKWLLLLASRCRPSGRFPEKEIDVSQVSGK